jgi:hypothetical protein
MSAFAKFTIKMLNETEISNLFHPENLPLTDVWFYCYTCLNSSFICEQSDPVLLTGTSCKHCIFRHEVLTTRVTNEFNNYFTRLRSWLYNGTPGSSLISEYIKIPINAQKHVSLIEDVFFLMHSLMIAPSELHQYVAIAAFMKARGSFMSSVSISLSILAAIARELYKDENRKDPLYDEICQRVEWEHQSTLEDLRSLLNQYNRVKDSTLFKKTHKFALYILSLGLLDNFNMSFDSLGFSKYEAKMIKQTHRPGFDMIYCITDTILFVCERGSEYVKTGDISTILSNGKGFSEWFADAQLIIQQSNFLSNPKPHGIDRFSFVSKLKACIEKGEAIGKFTTNLDAFEKANVTKVVYQLKMIEALELTRKAAQAPRKDPFGILVHGSSSICKSQFKQLLFYHYGKVFNLPTEPEYAYTRCPTDEYWSGFNSTQWCIVMDDIAFLKPNGEVDPTLKELLQVKNSVAYTPPQAALEDKGKTPVLAELIIGTTNTKSLNLNAYFSCPFAIARRLQHVVTVSVKPEFAKHNIMADSTKIPLTPEGEYMNIWNITVSEPEPEVKMNVDAQQTRYVEKHQFTDIDDFLAWYITVAKQHEVSQEKAMAADKTMCNVEVCMTCFRSMGKCSCPKVDAFEFQNDQPDDSEYSPEILQEDPYIDLSKYSLRFQVYLWILEKILTNHYIDLPTLYFFGETCMQRWSTLGLFWCFWLVTSSWYYGFFLFSFTLLCIIYNTIPYIWIAISYVTQLKYGYYWKLKLCYWFLPHDIETTYFLFMVLGRKVNKDRMRTAAGVIISLISTIITLYSLKTIYTMFFTSLREEGAVQSVSIPIAQKPKPERTAPMHVGGNTPQPQVEEKPTFYYHDPYVNTSIEISDASRCIKPFGVEQKLMNATAHITLHYSGERISTCAINIKGQIWIMNAHCVRDGSCLMDIVFENTSQNVSRNIMSVQMADTNFRIIKGTDIAFFETKACPPGKDLSMYLPTNDVIKGRYGATIYTKTSSGLTEKFEVANLRPGCSPMVNTHIGFCGKTKTSTKKGNCGSGYLAEIAGGAVLVGIHSAGNPLTREVFCATVTKAMLDMALSTYEVQGCATIVPLSLPEFEREILPIAERASIRWIEEGTANVLGTIGGFRPKPRSKVKPTFIQETVTKDGYINECTSPDMSKKAWFNNVKEMVKPNYKFCPKLLRKCVDAFTADVLKGVGDQIKMVEPYSQEVALNGVDGVTYVDKMNFSTSAGAPFRKSKKFFTEFDENNKARQLAEVVQTEIEVILNLYDKGDLYHPIYTGTLKDEATPKRKVLNCKTRLFACSTYPHSIVVRMSYLSIIRLIQNNPFIFEAMPGIVAQSDEWKRLYKYVTKHGLAKIIAGDFGFFDKHMIALLIMEAFQLCINLMVASGNYSEAELLRAKMIAFDIAYPTMDIDGLLVMIQQNPSGHPLTVIINCLVNSLYMRYVYVQITGKCPTTFQQYVSLATYGDDNIMGVSDEIPEFNHTAIAEALSKVGVKYTMAEKDAESVPYIHIKDASFLKRKFVFDEESQTVLAPLDHSSLDKMLTSYSDNGVLAPIAHSIAVIETALREYWFYGRDVFENRRSYFQKLISTLDIEDWVRASTFPTWDELRDCHIERSSHISPVELSEVEKLGIPMEKPDFMKRLAAGY